MGLALQGVSSGRKKTTLRWFFYRTALLVKNTIVLFYYREIYNCGASLEILDQVDTVLEL